VNVVGVQCEWTNESATRRDVVNLAAKKMVPLSITYSPEWRTNPTRERKRGELIPYELNLLKYLHLSVSGKQCMISTEKN
jgi:hypothetical protein